VSNSIGGALSLCILAFALGAIPFGFIAGKLRRKDLREHGSKNIGATNTLRVLGTGPGIAVLALDTLKGFAPVLLAKRMGLPSSWVVGVGLCAVLGHIYSPFVRFRGGKGVATSLGVLIGLSPLVAGLSFVAFLITVLLTHLVSLGSLVGAVTQSVLFFILPPQYLDGDPLPYRIFGAVAAAFVIYRHRENIRRLLAGTESRFGEKKAEAAEKE
jgi:glycerol-3-phosphate acyltransferase PlsY